MKLNIGDTVVVLPETDDYHVCVGQIVGKKPDPRSQMKNLVFLVKPSERHHGTHGHYGWKNEGVWCAKRQLAHPDDCELKVRAEVLYPNYWHSSSRPKEPFSLTKPCMVEGCDELCVRRILINIWGTVYEFDACGPHAEEYHGLCGESFPFVKSRVA